MHGFLAYVLKCNKDCEISGYLKDCTKKSLVEKLVVICDEIIDTPEAASINSNDKNKLLAYCYCSIANTIVFLLLLVVIVVKYCLKCELHDYYHLST